MDWLRHPRLRQCAQALAQGAVVAYPTEAVWGLGCDPFNHHAVQQIIDIKQRDADKGLILVAADIDQFGFLLHDLPAAQLAQLKAHWPGHTTFLVPHKNRVPAAVTGKFATVALRVSAHPLVKALCQLYGGPIVSTSANPQGKLPARSALKVRCYFKNALFIAPSAAPTERAPSKIFDLASGKQLR